MTTAASASWWRPATAPRTRPTRPRSSSASWATPWTRPRRPRSRRPSPTCAGSLESEDAGEINAKTEALQSAFHSVSEQMYAAAAQQAQAAGDGAGNGASADADADSEEEEVVDAEVVDEKEG